MSVFKKSIRKVRSILIFAVIWRRWCGVKGLDNVEKLVEIIETAATFIMNVNQDNISHVSLEYIEQYMPVSVFARELIDKYRVPLYISPHAIPCYTIDSIEKLLSATNEKEFIDALKQYVEEIEEWAKDEEKSLLDLSKELDIDIRKFSELLIKEEIYSNYWHVWNYGRYVGRARLTIFREKRELFTDVFTLYVAELYFPTLGYSIIEINTDDIDDIIEQLDELFEEYENSELTSYELYDSLINTLQQEAGKHE